MRPEIAFWLDYWVGRIICHVVSLMRRLSEMAIPCRPDTSPPEKILFLELSEMGAAILAYSAMLAAKERFPRSQVYFWIFKENAESVHILDIIPGEHVITTRTDNLFVLLLDTVRNLIRVRNEKIDTVVDMELFSRFTSILAYFSGAKRRVGFYKFTHEGLDRADIYTHKVMYNPYKHISNNFLTLVKSLDAHHEGPLLKIPLDGCRTTVPQVVLTAIEVEKIWDILQKANDLVNKKSRIVIINPGIGEFLSLRRWPSEYYSELIDRILKNDDDVFVILTGIKSESTKIENIDCLQRNKRIINLIGKTSVREMLVLCSIASIFISHDSGAVNLASLTPVDVVVLFGPETPVLYAPLKDNKKVLYKNLSCSPCFSAYNHRHSTCRDNRCLRLITVDEVYDAALPVLAKKFSYFGNPATKNSVGIL